MLCQRLKERSEFSPGQYSEASCCAGHGCVEAVAGEQGVGICLGTCVWQDHAVKLKSLGVGQSDEKA